MSRLLTVLTSIWFLVGTASLTVTSASGQEQAPRVMPVVDSPKQAPAQAVNEKRYSPIDAVVIAANDASALVRLGDTNIHPEEVVYLSLHNYSQAERKEKKAAVDFVLNSLNPRYRRITRTASLPPGIDDPIVVRVNLRDYGISRTVWNKLITTGSGRVPLPEPYFNEFFIEYKDTYEEESYATTEKQKTGRYYNGDPNQPEYKDVQVTKTKRIKTGREKSTVLKANRLLTMDPAAEPGTTIASLIENTQTKYPIARADWFITYATWAPIYYELIGLSLQPNPIAEDAKKLPKVFLERDFEDLLGADLKRARRDIVAAITDTKIVTLHNRIILRFSTVTGITGGSYWKSQDTDTGIDEEDYLLSLQHFDNPVIKAQEIIASGRNGLNFYALTDAKRRILDKADPNIAQHGETMPTRFQDKQVYSARNCMNCHAEGMINLKDKVRNIARGKIGLLIAQKTEDRDIALKIEEAFMPDPKAVIDVDNAKFRAATLAASGIEPKKTGAILENMIFGYYDAPVTLEKIAWEVGWETAKLEAALKEGVNLHYTLTAVLQEPPEEVSRLVWERQGYAALTQYLYAYTQKRKQ